MTDKPAPAKRSRTKPKPVPAPVTQEAPAPAAAPVDPDTLPDFPTDAQGRYNEVYRLGWQDFDAGINRKGLFTDVNDKASYLAGRTGREANIKHLEAASANSGDMSRAEIDRAVKMMKPVKGNSR